MVAPVKDRLRYYDYWIKFLNQLKTIIRMDDLYEMECDLEKLIMCIDFGYCKEYASDGVHKTCAYWWKSEVFNILTHLIKVQKTTFHKKDYYHDDIMEAWKKLLEETNEDIEVNLLILKGELEGCEIE